ncbi:MAG: hypothetical protein JWR20_352, partial [Marmoricola sp.]|nr:hypothetical protein [Marmoricola sp.]
MAGPNELKLEQAISGGRPGDLESRATAWRAQAQALAEAASDVRKARSDVEPYYQGSTDAAAAREALTQFAAQVDKQRTHMLSVAQGLDAAASALRTAMGADLGPGAPDAPTGDVTPQQEAAYQRSKAAAYSAREAAAKQAYDDLVQGYSAAASKMSAAAPPPPPDQNTSTGSGGGSKAPGTPASPVSSGYSSGGSGGGHGSAHVVGYSTDAHGTSVDLSPTGSAGGGRTPGIGQAALGSGGHGEPVAPGVQHQAGSPGSSSGVGSVLGNPVQAGGGAAAAGAAVAGG